MDVVTQVLESWEPLCLRAVIFDFDGTLTQPSGLSLLPIKTSLGCPDGAPLLEYIEGLNDKQRNLAHGQLAAYEMEAASQSCPNPQAQSLVAYLRSKDILTTILTRNHRQAVLRALENFETLCPSDFDLIITRDDLTLPKPGPEGIWHICNTLGIDPSEVLVVGDYTFDMQAGAAAGAKTVLLDPSADERLAEITCDLRIGTLSDLFALVDLLRPLPMGKFPNHWLERFFENYDHRDSTLIVAPGVGDDTAAVDINGESVLVLKSDPITFATDNMGYYAVLVNANDLATSGAVPRWFMATLLFPVGWSAAKILSVMGQLDRYCRQWKITLCGGHTELTDAVMRPIIAGMLAGTVSESDLIRKDRMRPGDGIFITKSIGLEGAAIIAGSHGEQLRAAGMSSADIDTLYGFTDQLSILPEARLAADIEGVSAMHDVTEGGVATALEELSLAGNCRLDIDMDCIPVHPLVAKMAALLNLDPLGLIGSGALIICCRIENITDLVSRLEQAGHPIIQVGAVIQGPQGLDASQNGAVVPWPRFDADELTRLY